MSQNFSSDQFGVSSCQIRHLGPDKLAFAPEKGRVVHFEMEVRYLFLESDIQYLMQHVYVHKNPLSIESLTSKFSGPGMLG
jgi:hypothetical protein